MKKLRRAVVLMAGAWVATSFAAEADLKAFPSAEGFGKFSKGGRGGQILIVDDLSDDPRKPKKNTFRWAVESVKGPRIIVFAKSGYITLKDNIDLKNPYITIAGQTAPEGGITVRGAEFRIQTHDVIVRHMRFRLGSTEGFIGSCNPKKDDCTLDSVSLQSASDVIFDHASLSWSVDEVFSGADSENVTIQNSIIAEGLATPKTRKGDWLHNEKHAHPLCSLFRGSSNIAFIHNVLSTCQTRLPQFSPKGDLSAKALVAGNYIHNYDPEEPATAWNSSSPRTKEAKYGALAIVNNYYDLPGGEKAPPISIEPLNKMIQFKAFLFGNLGPTRPNSSAGDDWKLVYFRDNGSSKPLTRKQVEAKEPFAPIDFEVRDAGRVPLELPEFVGATVPNRDEIDRDFFDRMKARKAGMIVDEKEIGGYPEVVEAVGAPDRDRDGMPDEWEVAHGSDPAKANPHEDPDGDGYTILDDYLEELATRN